MILKKPKLQVHLSVRYNFAFQHLSAAKRFAVMCKKVEDDNSGSSYGPFFDEITSFTTASIFSSVAALEANINETFQDAFDGILTIKKDNLMSLSEFWRGHEKRAPILKKYQTFLSIVVGKTMDDKTEPFESNELLVSLRNALVHYKPKWHGELKDFKDQGKRLELCFPLSIFVSDPSPIFPMRCMSSGCAQWAISSVKIFCDEFSQKTGTKNSLTSI